MSRHRPSSAYGHEITMSGEEYLISWTVDFYYSESRQRFPRRFKRWTDIGGARRFAKRHNVSMPSLNRGTAGTAK
jgi:hypothetical protein